MVQLPFPNREAAGRALAERLDALGLERPLVLAIPRGGIPVAAPIAERLDGDLDVIVVRKIGAPHNPELGLGAVGSTGEAVVDRRLVDALRVPSGWLAREIEERRAEAARREAALRGDRPPPDPSGRDVVVVDDGIATGGTVTAAGRHLRNAGARRLVLAVPVAPRESMRRIELAYDEAVALETPEPFFAVGQWYSDFRQVSDEEAASLLAVRQ
jgi:putative phosphoribosyl transferase